MESGPEHPAENTPQFEDAPQTHDDQPALPPPAGAPAVPVVSKSPPQIQGSKSSLISNTLLLVVGAALAAGGFGLARVYAPPRPPGETAGPPDEMVKKDDFKKLSDQVSQFSSDLDQVKKQIEAKPDFSSQFKLQRDRLDEVSQAVAEQKPLFDSMNQKIDTMGKVQSSNSPARLDTLDKQIQEMTQTVNSLKSDVAAVRQSPGRASSGSRVEDVNVEGLAMEQAVDLFKARKYTEARDAFLKLQSVFPDDARVWYYSALANGFASNEWLGETERMVNTGLAKEKAGRPDSAKIDAIFASLTPATGKDWLAGYRKRIGAR